MTPFGFTEVIGAMQERFDQECQKWLDKQDRDYSPAYGGDTYWDNCAREAVAMQMLDNVFRAEPEDES